MQKLQSIGLPSVVFEEKLFAAADKSLLYGAIMADSLTNAIDLEENIKRLPTVADVEPPASLLNHLLHPSSEEKLSLIGQIKQELAPLEFGVPDTRPWSLMTSAGRYMGFPVIWARRWRKSAGATPN